ncbi:MAG TPA: hypothetical protein VKR83_06105 [Ktedonobacteraceae bacterium]|nr:hypothetical protein [Ktedonobacteraceae bacterium]
MNVNSGGPHILLFERDQQLTGLLLSEFQLAGYECHAARTAVEVFDAIARYPIRLVLVNLAQAAANRREFWVALDAQRRGRGVQVFTFRCMNLAGYGPDDPEERSRAVLTDMEVDGMLGVMNLVDAVRARIPGATTGSFSRLNAQSAANGQDAPRLESSGRPNRPAEMDARAAQLMGQSTAPLSALMTSNPAASAAPISQPEPGVAPRTPTFTDKIRAVIYPGNRSYSPAPETNWAPHAAPPAPPAPRSVSSPDAAISPQSDLNAGDTGRATNLPTEVSGLEQLSRMVREGPPTWAEDKSPTNARMVAQPATAPAPAQEPEASYKGPQTDQVVMRDAVVENMPAQPAEPKSIADLPLRASPIEDVPLERMSERRAVPTEMPPPEVSPATAFKTTMPPTPSHVEVVEEIEAGDTGKRQETIETEQEVGTRFIASEERLRRRADPPATSEDVLLNIVQSLPPMTALPTPPPQTPVLSGRATRSLGNVLLEGHLVPQHRLEVAQNIQRMLRGVDMNYQLGEILLMFKLLTPDQLLAASLVSYGLIAAPQISALGRIRQELHQIGLEYDLESLLVLFRILTPDQLREVRASWSS